MTDRYIKVRNCVDCPDSELTNGTSYCKLLNRYNPEFKGIPDWCILPEMGDMKVTDG